MVSSKIIHLTILHICTGGNGLRGIYSSSISRDVRRRRRFRNGIDRFGNSKETAAQKRQKKRDAYRFEFNPDRTEDEEIREQIRKRDQAYNRRDPRVDPNDPRFGEEFFREKREIRRFAKCDRQNRGCYYVADVPTYVRINRIQEDRRYNDRYFFDYNDRYYRGIGVDIDDEIIYRTDRNLDLDDCEEFGFDLCDAIDLDDCNVICRREYRSDKTECRARCLDLDFDDFDDFRTTRNCRRKAEFPMLCNADTYSGCKSICRNDVGSDDRTFCRTECKRIFVD